MMVAQYLRAQARWRLASPGLGATRVARSVVALLDAASCIERLPDTHPDLEELACAGCFRGDVFDPGEAGLAVVRGWELADLPTGGQQDLLAALAFATSAALGGMPPAVRHEAPYGAARREPAPRASALHGAVPLPGTAPDAAPLPGRPR